MELNEELIERLKNGEIAVCNTLYDSYRRNALIRKIFNQAFPNGNEANGDANYYYKRTFSDNWDATSNLALANIKLPIVNDTEFLITTPQELLITIL